MYKLFKDPLGNEYAGVILNGNTSIPFDEANTDYQAYLKWVSEGNTPLPADE
jgi:hypothetical protein